MSSFDKNAIRIEESRKLFALFCNYIMPDIDFTPFHISYYRILHRFAIGKIKKLIVTVPPQHGKSLGSTVLLPSFMLGLNPDIKIAIGSYSTTFAQKFNRLIQRVIDTEEYRNLFPNTQLNSKNAVTISKSFLRNSNEFEIVGNKGYLKAVGRGGPLTGNQVDVMIMDDLYKDSMEGNSPTVRENVWEWYTSVVKTRLHNDSRELIVFTRWHEDDLIGRLEASDDVITINSLDDIDSDYKGWHKVNFEAIKDSPKTQIDGREIGEPLWPVRHSSQLLEDKMRVDTHIFNCMYQGNPSSKDSLLYGNNFKLYDKLPDNIIKVANYTDTADMGDDYLCSICYCVDSLGKIYITDALYTQENMEITEKLTSKMLIDNNIKQSVIESNNGGRGFSRSIKQMCPLIQIITFTQTKNKEARILTNAPSVINNIYMPNGWDTKWPKLFNHIINFKRLFRSNQYDDAADVLTAIVEREALSFSNKRFIML